MANTFCRGQMDIYKTLYHLQVNCLFDLKLATLI
uniref:Uncharacterized protein n=1 Tax=Anguilla anguilla TaxID=7936 RepID=A0A0E9WJJ5_ANGAN